VGKCYFSSAKNAHKGMGVLKRMAASTGITHMADESLAYEIIIIAKKRGQLTVRSFDRFLKYLTCSFVESGYSPSVRVVFTPMTEPSKRQRGSNRLVEIKPKQLTHYVLSLSRAICLVGVGHGQSAQDGTGRLAPKQLGAAGA